MWNNPMKAFEQKAGEMKTIVPEFENYMKSIFIPAATAAYRRVEVDVNRISK